MKKTIAIVLTLALCLGALAGCGSKKDSADKTITVAASPTPHAEILKVAGEVLAKDGWTLKVTEYADYVVPNNVVEDGECDANYFQHQPYLDTFNKENNTHLVSVAAIHYEPFGIYAGTKSSIADLADGDKIAIPNDGSNRARALLLLEANGILKLKEGVGMEATALDITESTPKVEIVEMEAAQIAGVRDSVALAVINGNYALNAGLNAGRCPGHGGPQLCFRPDLCKRAGGQGGQREDREDPGSREGADQPGSEGLHQQHLLRRCCAHLLSKFQFAAAGFVLRRLFWPFHIFPLDVICKQRYNRQTDRF